MRIIGHGIDIVETARLAAMVAAHGQHFLDRCFTPAEQAHCLVGKRRDEHLAGRFAAKEAVLKALGTGSRAGIAWTDMEILPDSQGKPTLTLAGQCAALAAKAGITQWHISISHITTHATASALASGPDLPPPAAL